jgi:hypothetical protein
VESAEDEDNVCQRTMKFEQKGDRRKMKSEGVRKGKTIWGSTGPVQSNLYETQREFGSSHDCNAHALEWTFTNQPPKGVDAMESISIFTSFLV